MSVEEARLENLDVELLIKLVRNHPMLWDPTHENYHNREIVRQTWNKIASKSGVGKHFKGETAKVKWRSLRENFRNELKKAKLANSGNDEFVFDSNWPWFNDMQFLLDVMSPVKVRNDNEDNQESYSDFPTETALDVPNSSLLLQSADDENSASGSSLRLKRTRCATANRRKRTTNSRELDNLEEEKFKQIEKKILEEKDDNYRFVMTLVPVLKQLPLYSQLNSRIKIQEILLSELLQLRKNPPLPQQRE